MANNEDTDQIMEEINFDVDENDEDDDDDEEWECGYCHKTFQAELSLNEHVENDHISHCSKIRKVSN